MTALDLARVERRSELLRALAPAVYGLRATGQGFSHDVRPGALARHEVAGEQTAESLNLEASLGELLEASGAEHLSLRRVPGQRFPWVANAATEARAVSASQATPAGALLRVLRMLGRGGL